MSKIIFFVRNYYKIYFTIFILLLGCETNQSEKGKTEYKAKRVVSISSYLLLYDLGYLKPDSTLIRIETFDSLGNVIERFQSGRVYSYKYKYSDSLLVEKLYYNDDGKLYAKETFKYDNNGNLLTLNKTVSKTVKGKQSDYAKIEQYLYDEKNQLSKIIETSEEFGKYETRNFYDGQKRMIRTKTTHNNRTTEDINYKYDNSGNLISTIMDGLIIEHKYFNTNKLIEKIVYKIENDNKILSNTFRYKYDIEGNMTEEKEFNKLNEPNGMLRYYYLYSNN